MSWGQMILLRLEKTKGFCHSLPWRKLTGCSLRVCVYSSQNILTDLFKTERKLNGNKNTLHSHLQQHSCHFQQSHKNEKWLCNAWIKLVSNSPDVCFFYCSHPICLPKIPRVLYYFTSELKGWCLRITFFFLVLFRNKLLNCKQLKALVNTTE